MLVRIKAAGGQLVSSPEAGAWTSPAWPLDPAVACVSCERVNSVLLGYLLGYDLDPASVQRC